MPMKIPLRFLIVCFWFVAQMAVAQILRPAVLHKLDKSSLPVKIDRVNPTNIVYVEASAPKVKKVIGRNQVWKIVYANGTTQVITPLTGTNYKPNPVTAAKMAADATALTPPETNRPDASATPAPTLATGSASPPTAAPSAPTSRSTTPQANVFSTPRDDEFNRLQLSVGPEMSFFPSFINKDRAWVNDTIGFGMKQNVGFGLRADYRIIRPVAVSFSVGYAGWELVRNFSREGVPAGTETVKLTRIPVQGGLKLYPDKGGLYLMPEAGVTLLRASLSAADATSAATESVSKTAVNYGGSIGYEIRKGSVLLDLSVRYNLMNVKGLAFATNSTTIDESVHAVSVRLGIGFGTLKK